MCTFQCERKSVGVYVCFKCISADSEIGKGTGCFVHFPWKMFSFILLGAVSFNDSTVVSSRSVYYVSGSGLWLA